MSIHKYFFVSFTATMGATESSDLTVLFDIGGIVGGITAGVLSDHSDMPATICSGMLILAAPFVSKHIDEYQKN